MTTQHPAASASIDLDKLIRWTFDGGMTAAVSKDGQWLRYTDVERAAFLARRATHQPSEADEWALAVAQEAAYPYPGECHHTSVKMRHTDQLLAFRTGWRAALTHRATTEPATTSDAVRIAKKQMADPKLAGPGATAHERYLHIELEVLQRAVIRCASSERVTTAGTSIAERAGLIPQGMDIAEYWRQEAAKSAARALVLKKQLERATAAEQPVDPNQVQTIADRIRNTAGLPAATTASASGIRGYFMRHKSGEFGFSWDKNDTRFPDEWERIEAVEARATAPSREAAKALEQLADQASAQGCSGSWIDAHVATIRAALAQQAAAPGDGEALRKEVSIICQLLDDGEWGEHIARTCHGQNLETAITRLVGKVNQGAAQAQAGGSDARDAARYRWLRDKSEPGICAFYLSVGKAFHSVKFARETVDEAIDAAMSAAGQEGGK